MYVNRLILEDSPYLIQHAHNPVNWYPWGPEAFETARRENKPIFLSIGYSTCHWCHVMEEGSFDDEEGANLIDFAVAESLSRHEDRLGGFSKAPKFPHEPELLFLLDRALRFGDRRALAAVETSLDHMARGGIYDQVGGGFHRYSTDAQWLVPHFEKMLYNQAHLARAYLEASRLTGNVTFERVARQTLDYVLRDMTSRDGAFYSATDADSEGHEGEFFVWTPTEIRTVLSPADAELAVRIFGMSDRGNFESKNILYLPKPLPEVAEAMRVPLAAFSSQVRRRPTAFAYMLLGAEELLNGGAGALGYAAGGIVRAKASLERSVDSSGRLTVLLDIADGWHVNSDRPLQDELIPTRLAVEGDGWELTGVEYPGAKQVKLGFQNEQLAVFQGTLPIRAALAAKEAHPPGVVRLRLTVQACDDRKCLRPEDMLLELPVGIVRLPSNKPDRPEAADS